GAVIDKHMKAIGLIQSEEMSDIQKRILAQKRAEFDARQQSATTSADEPPAFPASATLCKKCSAKSVIIMDGCMTCLNGGDSNCGYIESGRQPPPAVCR